MEFKLEEILKVCTDVHKQVLPYIEQMVMIEMKINHFKKITKTGEGFLEGLSELIIARQHYEGLIAEDIEEIVEKSTK